MCHIYFVPVYSMNIVSGQIYFDLQSKRQNCSSFCFYANFGENLSPNSSPSQILSHNGLETKLNTDLEVLNLFFSIIITITGKTEDQSIQIPAISKN